MSYQREVVSRWCLLLAIICLGLLLTTCQGTNQQPVIETVQFETHPASVTEVAQVSTIETSPTVPPPQWLNDNVMWVHLP